jgi:acyl-CoA thioester hydrolase
MLPKPFKPEALLEREKQNNCPCYRDSVAGLVWHRCETRTLYADTDRSSVVYHSNYLRYFELGRATLMRDTGYPYKEVEESGFIYPVIDLGIQFYQPLHYDDPIHIFTRPAELERVRLRFDYLIIHGDTQKIVCKGFTKHCALNATGKPVAVDPKTVHLWKTFPV